MEITKEKLELVASMANHKQLLVMYEAVKSERDALAAQVLKLEKIIKAINEGVEEYKSMSNDATACLVHKALMSVREEIIQRDLYQTAPDFIEQFANQYADSIRREVK